MRILYTKNPVWILILSGLVSADASAGVEEFSAGASRGSRSMKLLSKQVFLRHQNKRPPASGFVTYISTTRPVLMHCHGWEDYSDGYDDYSVSVSDDNGNSWSAEEVRWKSRLVPEGRIRYAEPAAFFDPDREKLIVLIDQTLYPKDKLNADADYALVREVYDPRLLPLPSGDALNLWSCTANGGC